MDCSESAEYNATSFPLEKWITGVEFKYHSRSFIYYAAPMKSGKK